MECENDMMSGADVPLRGLRVLLVEDACDTREVLERLLEAEGAEVVSAGTAREATDIATLRDFDVLLTDLGLPDIPGDALIRKVLADARRRPYVIAITGYGEPHAGRARRAGADVVLTKPIGWTELVAHLGPRASRVDASEVDGVAPVYLTVYPRPSMQAENALS